MRKLIILSIAWTFIECSATNDRANGDHSQIPILEGQSNFRDLGGYETIDGRKVKSGVIFRSGELTYITDEDVAKLDSIGILTVINFLTEEEIQLKGDDRVPENAQSIFLELNSGDMAMEVQKMIRSGDFENIPPDQNAQFHSILTDEKKEEYGIFIKELNSLESPVVFHCSHGVHRTGTATAIFLSLLGVPWETVREDYLLTNLYRSDENAEILEKMKSMVAEKKGISPSEVDMTNIEAFYILKGSYIDATRDYVIENYGSFENYAIIGMGLSQEDIINLKNRYLE